GDPGRWGGRRSGRLRPRGARPKMVFATCVRKLAARPWAVSGCELLEDACPRTANRLTANRLLESARLRLEGGAHGLAQRRRAQYVDAGHRQHLGAVDDATLAVLGGGATGELLRVQGDARRRDADHRVNRRQELADVAHVGTAADVLARRVDHPAAELLEVGAVGGLERGIAPHVGVVLADPSHVILGAAGERAGLKARL